MPIKAVVNTLDEVEETLRPHYVERDGRYVLGVDPVDGYELDNVRGLRTALGAERSTRSGLETRLREFDGIEAGTARAAMERLNEFGDLQPQDIRTRLATLERLEKLNPETEAERLAQEKFNHAKSQLQGQFTTRETQLTTQISDLEGKLAAREKQVTKFFKTGQIKGELSKLNPLPEARDMLEMVADRDVRHREVDGNIILEVLDENGHPRIKDHLGTPFTLADYMTELREKRPALFQADGKSGLGTSETNRAPSGQAAGPQGNPFKPGASFSITQQMILMRSDPAKAARLQSEAGV